MANLKGNKIAVAEKFKGIISTTDRINYTDFRAALSVVLNEVREFFPYYPATKSTYERLEAALKYNVPNMDKIRGYMLVKSYSEVNNHHLSPDEICKSYILGWIVQIVQTPVLFLLDDYLDQDPDRWGKPTWWTCTSNPDMFVNDLFLMVQCALPVLKHYFGDHPRYTEMIEFLNSTMYEFVVGQDIDCQEQKARGAKLSTFTMDARVLKWTLLNYKFVLLLPHQMALLLADIPKADPVWRLTEHISYLLAEFATFVNDYYDCFNKSSANVDIRQGRLTYVVLWAKGVCSETQIEELVKYYGVDSDEAVDKVLTLYKTLGIDKWAAKHMATMDSKIKLKLKEMAAMPLSIASSMEAICDSMLGEGGFHQC